MSFKGDLSTIGLGEVFQMISMSQKEGTLIVQDSESRKCVFFGVSGVQLLSSGRRKGLKLGDMLLRAGKVTEAQLEDALENARIQKKKLGEVLVESGMVTEDEIKAIVREQIEEEIYDLFLWKKADFEFIEGPAADELKDPDAQVTALSFDVNGLLLEAVRRSDEWAVINQSIPSIDSIFTFVSESDRHEEDKIATDPAKRIYRLVDGRMPHLGNRREQRRLEVRDLQVPGRPLQPRTGPAPDGARDDDARDEPGWPSRAGASGACGCTSRRRPRRPPTRR